MSTPPLFIQESCFYSSGGLYPADARAQIAADLGYAGVNPVLISRSAREQLPALLRELDRLGLRAGTVYVTLNMAASGTSPLRDALTLLAGRETQIETGVRWGSKGEIRIREPGDEEAVLRALDEATRAAERHDMRVSLYPHAGFWLETGDQGLALLERLGQNVGVSFSLSHWLAADGATLPDLLARVRPRLRNVNLCGSTKLAAKRASVEPIGAGAFDMFWLLSLLRRGGYAGPFGLLGFGLQGDVYAHLRHSIHAWRDLWRRVLQHPEWAAMTPAD